MASTLEKFILPSFHGLSAKSAVTKIGSETFFSLPELRVCRAVTVCSTEIIKPACAKCCDIKASVFSHTMHLELHRIIAINNGYSLNGPVRLRL